jgi:phage gp29-like protein
MATSKTPLAKAAAAPIAPPMPELNTEVANRLRDPFEHMFNGLIRTNDPLMLERGNAGNNYELYKDLKRDGKVYSGLQKRKLALISRPWKVDPVEDGPQGQKDAEIVQGMLKRLMFDKVCSELLDALILGFVPSEVIWTERDNMIVPKRVVKRAQRRFVYVQTDPHDSPELRLLTVQNMLTGEPLPERKFIVHRFNPEDDNPYGTGLGLQLYWPVFFKRKGILSWNKLNDRFGSPTPHGKYPNGAGAKEKGTLFDALKAMSNDGVLMTPEGMSIELLESKLTGSISTQRELCAYMDNWISEVILSQEATQTTGATGAAANEREDVRLDLVQADADLLSDTLNSTLIEWICEYNGLTPCTVSRVIKKPEDLLAASQTDVNIASLGFKPTLESVRARYGEGWDEAPTPAPLLPPPALLPGIAPAIGPDTSGKPPQAKPTSFAEPAPAKPALPTDPIAATMGKAGDIVLADWMTKIAAMVQAAPTTDALRDALVNAYGDLPTDQLQQVMALAFAAAELAGLDAVVTETGQNI